MARLRKSGSVRIAPAHHVAKPKASFVLENWYASEEAKRCLGSLCQAVNEQGAKITLLGGEGRPTLTLEDADAVDHIEGEIELSIDEAKADWSAVTAAALFFGTAFRILGKHRMRAVLRRHPTNRHAAMKYRRFQPEDMAMAAEHLLEELRRVSSHFDSTTELLQRRFTEIWRDRQGLPPPTG